MQSLVTLHVVPNIRVCSSGAKRMAWMLHKSSVSILQKNVNWEQKQNIQDLFKPNEDFKLCVYLNYVLHKGNDFTSHCIIKYMLSLRRQMCWFYIALPLRSKHATMIYCDFWVTYWLLCIAEFFHLRILKGAREFQKKLFLNVSLCFLRFVTSFLLLNISFIILRVAK